MGAALLLPYLQALLAHLYLKIISLEFTISCTYFNEAQWQNSNFSQHGSRFIAIPPHWA